MVVIVLFVVVMVGGVVKIFFVDDVRYTTQRGDGERQRGVRRDTQGGGWMNAHGGRRNGQKGVRNAQVLH